MIDSDPEEFDTARLPENVLNAVEADSFWCLSRLLDGIQDNYIQAQPGIQRSVRRMADLVARIDGTHGFCTLIHHCPNLQTFSAIISTSGISKCGVYAVCVQVDELLVDAGDQCKKYHQDVGYLPGKPIYLTSSCG